MHDLARILTGTTSIRDDTTQLSQFTFIWLSFVDISLWGLQILVWMYIDWFISNKTFDYIFEDWVCGEFCKMMTEWHWKYSWLVMLWYLVAWQYMIQDWVIHKPCWDACWRCSWQSSRNTRLTHDANDIVSPDRESQMYSHYIMLCEHSWWYLSLGSSSQLH